MEGIEHSPNSMRRLGGEKTMSQKFAGKIALVTGGNSGIGLAAALAFAKEGARIVITGRDQATLDKAAVQLGEKVVAVRSDAGSVADGIKLATLLQQQGVMLDAVFINAGVAKLAPFGAVEEEMWDATFNTNLKGPYFLIKALLPCLNPGAAIVLNGSINAHIGMPNTSVYAASKAALISLAKTLSSELLSRGVRVNVVSPGPVTTPLLSAWVSLRSSSRKLLRASKPRSPSSASGRRGRSRALCCIWHRPIRRSSLARSWWQTVA
jgi:NAD(P)-dependent dehydrogenase (short-subunit alcohol dehydrogenase family)